MGIYDRDYERDDSYRNPSGFDLGGARSWTTNLVIAMGLIYLVQLFTNAPNGGPFTRFFSLYADLPLHPWRAFSLLTYGFLHDPNDLKHILFNAFALWMFGRFVENRYGKVEYLIFFLTSVVVAGLVWIGCEWLAAGGFGPFTLVGASGGIAAVLLLFCVNFPRQQIFIWGVLPIPAWAFALIFLGMNLFGASGGRSNVAYTAHIGGALFALVYYFTHMQLARWIPGQWKLPKLGGRPNLRVHEPTDDEDSDDTTDDAVDRILRKIRERGQESLTRQERQILEEASREYQKRRQ